MSRSVHLLEYRVSSLQEIQNNSSLNKLEVLFFLHKILGRHPKATVVVPWTPENFLSWCFAVI